MKNIVRAMINLFACMILTFLACKFDANPATATLLISAALACGAGFVSFINREYGVHTEPVQVDLTQDDALPTFHTA